MIQRASRRRVSGNISAQHQLSVVLSLLKDQAHLRCYDESESYSMAFLSEEMTEIDVKHQLNVH